MLETNSEKSEHNSTQSLVKVLLVVLIAGVIGNALLMWLVVQQLRVSPSQVFEKVSHVEELLIQSQATNNVLIDVATASDSSIVQLDRHGKIIMWSDGAEQLFGVNRDDAMGYGIAFMVPPNQRDKHKKAFDAAMESQKKRYKHVIQCDCLHANGDVFPVRIVTFVEQGVTAISVFEKAE